LRNDWKITYRIQGKRVKGFSEFLFSNSSLLKSKIDVVYIENLPSDIPILHVEVNGSSKNDKTFSFLIQVELWQKSFLKRDPKVEVIAATWSTGVFGSGLASNIANDIMGLMNSMTDTFVKAYLSVNSY